MNRSGTHLVMFLLFITALRLMQNDVKAKTFHADTSQVYTAVEVMPELIGGLDALYSILEVPASVHKGSLKGHVFLKLTVDQHGKVIQARILKDIGEDCGENAIRAIKHIQFTPGKLNDIPVKVSFTMPVLFEAEIFNQSDVSD